MRPPICALCDNDFRHDGPETGGLVTFADYTPLPEGMTGHPSGLEWFCGQHYEAASQLSDLTTRGALAKLREP